MGDSLQAQLFYSAACLLKQNCPTETTVDTPYSVSAWQPELSCRRGIWRLCIRLMAARASSAARLCYVPADMGGSTTEKGGFSLGDALAALYSPGEPDWLGPRDVLVANMGLHHKDIDTASGRMEVRDLMQQFLSVYNMLPPPRPRLMWRETTAQHYDHVPWGAYVQGKPGERCVPHKTAKDPYNLLTTPLVLHALASSTDVLRIWQFSAVHHDQHPAKHGSPHADCTHFCQQGGVPDMWVTTLVNAIMSHTASEEHMRYDNESRKARIR